MKKRSCFLFFILSLTLGESFAEQSLKVLTVNLHSYQELKQIGDTPLQRINRNKPILSKVAQAINDLDADIVCLQEVAEWRGDVSNPDQAPFGQGKSNAGKVIKNLLNSEYYLFMDWSHYAWNEWREGVAILSKTAFTKTGSRFVSHSQRHDYWKSRNIVAVTTSVKPFGTINVISAHTGWWDDKEEPFQYQFKNIALWRDQLKSDNPKSSTFVCGDLNIKAGGAGYSMITQNYNFSDAYYVANPTGLTDATIGKGIDASDGKGDRIDYLLLDKDSQLQVTSAKRLFRKNDYGRVSDHLGVFFTLIRK